MGRRVDSKELNLEDLGKEKRITDVIPRTTCSARMTVVHKVKTNKWRINKVELEHNHSMVSPKKVQFFPRSRNIDPITRSLIELFNKSGIETSKVMKYLGETVGGMENLGFLNQDIRNVIRDIRRWVFDFGDAECGLMLLRQLEVNSCDKFFYRVDVDEGNRDRGLVWVDPRSMNAYKNFGDVVTFNLTYRTNRDEKETSYMWVLKTWLEAIDNKSPIAIITDQDITLGNTITEVMLEIKNTYCTWHISQKFIEKLSHVYDAFPDFKSDFKACVYKSLTPKEFEGRWEALVEKYKIDNDDWLSGMFGIRRQWIGTYRKQHFVTDMTTTSRSESMNAFFDEYLQASTGLKDFIENLQKALESQYLNEVKEEYDTEYKRRKLILNSSLEIYASKIYTKEMLRHFQNELLKSTSYTVKRVSESYMLKLYEVEKSTVPEGNGKIYQLVVPLGGMIEYNCKKFEHSGMICKHMIHYLDKKQAKFIPSEYIILRWTINGNKIAGPLPYMPLVLANVGKSQSIRYSSLCKSFQCLGAIGSCSISWYNYVMGVIEREKSFVQNPFPKEERNERMNEEEVQKDLVFDPPMSQNKGRKKETRIKSEIETSMSKPKP